MKQINAGMSAGSAGAVLLQHYLAAWKGLLPVAYLGRDPEALHQLRVSGRRLLAVLSVLDAAEVRHAGTLRHQLKDFLGDCGRARDLDIEIAALESLVVGNLPAAFAAFQRRLRLRRLAAQENLRRLFDSLRSRGLLDALQVLKVQAASATGARPIAEVACDLIRHYQRSASRAADRVQEDPSLAHCHALRLKIKKLRYVAEGFVPLFGKPLEHYLRRLRRLQSLLGTINDMRHLIPVFEVETVRARSEGSGQAALAYAAAVEKQRMRLKHSRDAVLAEQARLGGERWRDACVRMEKTAGRRQK